MRSGARPLTIAWLALLAIVPYATLHELTAMHFALLSVQCTAFAFAATRSFAATLLPFTLFLFVYDSLRSIALHVLDRVIVGPFFRAEALLFGVEHYGEVTIPAAALLNATHPALDVIGAVFYSLHVPVVALMAVLLLWRGDRERVARFAWGFLALNLIANAIQVVFPVAPPWFVFQHGVEAAAVAGVGDAAGLLRFDALIGTPHFESIYRNASYVYGAFPSLHVAFPAWVACNAKSTRGKVAGAIFTALMAFFAVYLQHHYVLDVFAGAGLAVLVYAAVSSQLLRNRISTLHARLSGAVR